MPAGSIILQPNYIYGMVHYGLQLLATVFSAHAFGRTLSLGGIGATIFFTYAMYKIGALCLACVVGHIINIALYYIDYFGSYSKIKID